MTAPRRALRLLLATFAVAALLLLGLLWLRPGADPQVEGSMPAAADLDDATPLSDHPAAQRIAVDLRRLADDSMEGRETGSRGHDLAAAYVAAQFADAGLEPAGDDGGFFQTVPLLRAVPQAEGARLAVMRGGRTIELKLGDQFLPWANFSAGTHRVEAPAVFVGHAIHAPDIGHDDFAGLDLAGRIAVLLPGAPQDFDDQHRAYHSALQEKLAAVAARGDADDQLGGRAAPARRSVSFRQARRQGPWPRRPCATPR